MNDTNAASRCPVCGVSIPDGHIHLCTASAGPMQPPGRRPIGVLSTEYGDRVLCDDGSVWVFSGVSWYEFSYGALPGSPADRPKYQGNTTTMPPGGPNT